MGFKEKRLGLAIWTTRYGGWLCLAMIAGLGCFRTLSYGGQIIFGLFAALLLLASGFEPWRGKFPLGTGLAVAVFVAVFIPNAFFSVDPARTIAAWPFRFWLLMSLPIGLAFIDAEPVRRWGLYALMAGTGLGFFLVLLDLWQNPNNLRPSGNMGIMEYAGVVGLTFPFLLAHLINLMCRPSEAGSGRGLAWLLLVAVNISLVGILLNGTRIIFISAVATATFLALSYGRRLSRRAVYALLTLPLITAFTFAAWPQTFSRATSLVELNPPAQMLTSESLADDPVESAGFDSARLRLDHSASLRLEMWRRALKMIPDHPFFGCGLRTIPNDPDPGTGISNGIFSFHNTYLQFVVETGIFGLMALMGLFIPGLRLALKRFDDPDPDVRMWSRIAIALLLGLAIHAATDNLLFYRSVIYLYGLLTAWAWTRLSPTT